VIEAFGVFLSVPGYLVIAVVVYSMVFTTSMMLIGRHLTRVSDEYKRAEAELRAKGLNCARVAKGIRRRKKIKAGAVSLARH
jgi:putative ATP-binding cassette transporter